MTAQAARNHEYQLIEDIASFTHDPWGFVLYAYPWGEGELKGKWPMPWQEEKLKSIGLQLQEKTQLPDFSCIIRQAEATGHGIGKSALLAWLGQWAMSTMTNTRGFVTASTKPQLKTKTIPEFAKWYQLLINSHWFDMRAESMVSADPNREHTWRLDFIAWSENNPEAFQGMHNEGRRLIILFDEASSIADVIWETVDKAITDKNTEIIFCAWGNPTRRSGYFRSIFTKLAHRWKTKRIDSRDVEITNKEEIQALIEDYGIDSNTVRIRVKGQHPTSDLDALVDFEWLEAAKNREPEEGAEVVIGVDVGRKGKDPSAICIREGGVKEIIRLATTDTMKLIGRVVVEAEKHKAKRIYIDEIGVGGGPADRLKELVNEDPAKYKFEVVEVNVAHKSKAKTKDGKKFKNKKAELYWKVREWFQEGEASVMTHCAMLEEQILNLQWDYTSDGSKIFIEEKKLYKQREGYSPDEFESLMLTFDKPKKRGSGVVSF